ncbi:MAG: PPOX class F420-dependent oxidoreductase [Acidimicrobiia bacterium]|nr:PPOX class F420-dependent oxidoreductase [Acidimicrobiia bacterium]
MGLMERLAKASDKFYDRMRSADATNVAHAEPTGRMADLTGHKYCVLVSYRRNGQPVPSPLWFGVAGDKLYFQTSPDGYKVKRIANNPEVRVAPCTSRGKPLGPPFTGAARILPDGEAPTAERALRSNYGVGRRIYTAFSDKVPSVYVEVTPTVAG